MVAIDEDFDHGLEYVCQYDKDSEEYQVVERNITLRD